MVLENRVCEQHYFKLIHFSLKIKILNTTENECVQNNQVNLSKLRKSNLHFDETLKMVQLKRKPRSNEFLCFTVYGSF